MTVAARARIERGVVERLREAPDGRPRREQLSSALRETLVEQRLVIPAGELRLLERWLEDRLFGLGELAPLLRDERVTEVMVNGMRGVWVERDGRLEETPIHFGDPEEILVLIERLVAPLGRRIDLASPLVDAWLADGSRVHAVIPPISLVGPVLGAFASDIIHTGAVGSAQVAKAANNLILWACLVADHEALALAQCHGLDVERLRRALGMSSAANDALAKWGLEHKRKA